MTSTPPTISPAFLWDTLKEDAVDAEIWDQITEAQINDWGAKWVPVLGEGLARLVANKVPSQQWPQSSHWDWRLKVRELRGLLYRTGFSIMCEGETQGMMCVDTASYRCRIASQAGQHLVYVDYVESAPWNRAELLLTPRYKGVGSVLVGAAIQFSIAEGFQGRIGLHSLPQSCGFYAQHCGMTEVGEDKAKQGLRYFEMTAAQAQAFIDKGNQP